MLQIHLADHLDDLLGAGAAELAQQALDLGLNGHHLHAAEPGDLRHLLVLEQQLDQLVLRRRQGGHVVDEENQGALAAAQTGVLLHNRDTCTFTTTLRIFIGLSSTAKRGR